MLESVKEFIDLIESEDLMECEVCKFPVIRESAKKNDRAWDSAPFDCMEIYKNENGGLILFLGVYTAMGYYFFNTSEIKLEKVDDNFMRFSLLKEDGLSQTFRAVLFYFESSQDRDQFFDFVQRF
jgi:hypothetical protein